MWKIVALLLCACIAAKASITLELRNTDENHNGHCYAKYKKLGELSKAESKQIPNECKLATCLDNGDVIYTTCEIKRVNPPCYLTEEDPSKVWPKCCAKFRCPGHHPIDIPTKFSEFTH